MKQDLARLVELYSSMPDEVLQTGLFTFAQTPPKDTSYIVTRPWDAYLPFRRGFKEEPQGPRDSEADRKLIEEINIWVDGGPGIQSHDEHDVDRLDHVTISRNVMPTKGRWQVLGGAGRADVCSTKESLKNTLKGLASAVQLRPWPPRV